MENLSDSVRRNVRNVVISSIDDFIYSVTCDCIYDSLYDACWLALPISSQPHVHMAVRDFLFNFTHDFVYDPDG